jgi:hypothetical protein
VGGRYYDALVPVECQLDSPHAKQHAPLLRGLTPPAQVVAIALQTGYSSPAEIDRRIKEFAQPGNCRRRETIEEKRKEFAANAKENSALWDSAPILCVACCSDDELFAFDGMTRFGRRPSRDDQMIIRLGDEKKMLQALRTYLDLWHGCGKHIILVGQNIKHFDLPKLRLAYLRHRLAPPEVLRPIRDAKDESVRVIDLMHLFAYQFSLESRGERGKSPFVSFDTVMRYLGLETHPEEFSSAHCPHWHEQGRYDLVLERAILSAMDEYRAYRLMSGEW